MYKLSLDKGARFIWAAVGGAMLAAGARRRSFWDTACGIAGSGMLVWAFAAPAALEEPARDMVDISSEDSFPASDPPSSW
jgi:hypothetical protein